MGLHNPFYLSFLKVWYLFGSSLTSLCLLMCILDWMTNTWKNWWVPWRQGKKRMTCWGCLLQAATWDITTFRWSRFQSEQAWYIRVDVTARIQLPGCLARAGAVVDDVPGEKSAEVGPHTTSLSFVPFTSTDFPSKEQLSQWKEFKSLILVQIVLIKNTDMFHPINQPSDKDVWAWVHEDILKNLYLTIWLPPAFTAPCNALHSTHLTGLLCLPRLGSLVPQQLSSDCFACLVSPPNFLSMFDHLWYFKGQTTWHKG